MVTLSLGTKKRTFKSIREAASFTGIKYITLYQRLRIMKPAMAVKKPVRKYVKKVVN
jgi:hypothetical protein